MAELAINGGCPLSTEPVNFLSWPPRSEKVADQLRELYLSGKWSFNGENEQAFSKEYAEYHGAKHGVFMANGTVTLQSALTALEVGPGDEVIVPGLTWIATAMAVRYVGAIPVFVDIEPTTLCLDPEKFEAAITPNTKAVIPVHLYASMADIERIGTICARRNLKMIEDCAHMQGGIWNGRGVGSWGDVGSFSFQQSKTLSAGESGICLTNDDKLAELMFRVKHIGYGNSDAQGGARSGPPSGLTCHNFRGTEFQALILRDQLRGLKNLIAKYNRSARTIRDRLADFEGVRIQSPGRLATEQGFYAFPFIFDGETTQNIPIQVIQKALAAEGLNLGGTYGPVYSHLLFNLRSNDYRIADGGCPVSEHEGTARALMAPHQMLGATEDNIDKIVDIVAKVVTNVHELRDIKLD